MASKSGISTSPPHSSPRITSGSRYLKQHFRPKQPAPFTINKSGAKPLDSKQNHPTNENHSPSDNDDGPNDLFSYLDKEQLSAAVKLAKLDLERKRAQQNTKFPPKTKAERSDNVYLVKESGIGQPLMQDSRAQASMPPPKSRTMATTQTAPINRRPPAGRAQTVASDRAAAQQLSELQEDVRFLLHQTAALNLNPEEPMTRRAGSVSSIDSQKSRSVSAKRKPAGKHDAPLRYREFLDAEGPEGSFDNLRPFHLNSEPPSGVTATGLRPRRKQIEPKRDQRDSELRVEQVLFGYAPETTVRVSRNPSESALASNTSTGHMRTHTERVLVELKALSAEADRLLKELGEVGEALAAGNTTVRRVYERRLALVRSTALDVVRRTLDRFESARHSSRCLAAVYAELRKLFAKLSAACVLFRAPTQLRVEHVVRRDPEADAKAKAPRGVDVGIETDPEIDSDAGNKRQAVRAEPKPKAKTTGFTDAECSRVANRATAQSHSPTESWLAHSGREFTCRSRTASTEPPIPSPKRRSTPVREREPSREREREREHHREPSRTSRGVQSGADSSRDVQVQANDPDRIAAQLLTDAHRREQPVVHHEPLRRVLLPDQDESAAFPLFDPHLHASSKRHGVDSDPGRLEAAQDGRLSPFSVDVVVRRIDSLQAEQQRIRERWLQLNYADFDDPVARVQRAARRNESALQPQSVKPAEPTDEAGTTASVKPIYFHKPQYETDDALGDFVQDVPVLRNPRRQPLGVPMTVSRHDFDAVCDYRARHDAFLRNVAGQDDRDAKRPRRKGTATGDVAVNAAQVQSAQLVNSVSEAILGDCVTEAVGELDSAMHTIVQQLVAHELYEAPNATASAQRRSIERASLDDSVAATTA